MCIYRKTFFLYNFFKSFDKLVRDGWVLRLRLRNTAFKLIYAGLLISRLFTRAAAAARTGLRHHSRPSTGGHSRTH